LGNKYDRLAGAIFRRKFKRQYWRWMKEQRERQVKNSIGRWQVLFMKKCKKMRKLERILVFRNEILRKSLKKARSLVAGVITGKVKQIAEERRELVQKRWSDLVAGEVKKCFSIVKLKVKTCNALRKLNLV
jgi:hypothetical protein